MVKNSFKIKRLSKVKKFFEIKKIFRDEKMSKVKVFFENEILQNNKTLKTRRICSDEFNRKNSNLQYFPNSNFLKVRG